MLGKKAAFFIDDVLWVFRDLTRKRPASLFDNEYMAMLKRAYDEYGVKVQLNAFYKTSFWYGDDEFSLSDMTDAYKKEWEEASHWLKIGFHSKEEWPDYPYINADYSLVNNNFNKDKETGMSYMSAAQVVLNLTPLEILEGELSKFTHQEYLCLGTHEQYFYPDYYAYQPDYAECVYTMGRIMKENGYEFIFAEELPH